MFDAEHATSSSGVSDTDSCPSGSDRRQYTLKGVEAEAIRLMREAASREGMKIGSWVSARIREAAERTLADEGYQLERTPDLSVRKCGGTSSQRRSPERLNASETDQRFAALEAELKEIAAAQRAIMTFLLQERTRSEKTAA